MNFGKMHMAFCESCFYGILNKYEVSTKKKTKPRKRNFDSTPILLLFVASVLPSIYDGDCNYTIKCKSD